MTVSIVTMMLKRLRSWRPHFITCFARSLKPIGAFARGAYEAQAFGFGARKTTRLLMVKLTAKPTRIDANFAAMT